MFLLQLLSYRLSFPSKVRNRVICEIKQTISLKSRPLSTQSDNKTTGNLKLKNHKNVDLRSYPVSKIRNFCIIAHIDHGKSTLSDRLLELTETISKDESVEQYLDKLQVERERGITVKAQTCSLIWKYKQESYLLNLIDTPGHVDFSYEVWRSISVCEGAILLVDANSGVQAQTIAHFNHALLAELTMIPVLNKIDLKNADPESVAIQMKKLFEFDSNELMKVSAKQGIGIEELLNTLIEKIPPPKGDVDKPLKATIFDIWHEKFKGIILLIRVIDGYLKTGDSITLLSTNKSHIIQDVSILYPDALSTNVLYCGQVGLLCCNIHDNKDVNIGDVLVHSTSLMNESEKICNIPTVPKAIPMVFASIYPCEQSCYSDLAKAINKLLLNDNGVDLSKESHPALGNGFRLGFLGLLHMEVFCQRLDDEFDAQVMITAPSVPYKVKIIGEKNIKLYGSEELVITNAINLPNKSIISEYFEPMVIGTIITPDSYLSGVTSLCMSRRGVQTNSYYIDNTRLVIQFRFPMSEIIIDFYDALKSVTSGYASFDYEDDGYEKTDLVKLDILLNDNPVEELSSLVHVKRARNYGKSICAKLKESIRPKQFKIKIQAAIGGKFVAREDIRALRKDVTAKLYGGDSTRRMKLLQRQAEGKRRLRMIGNIEISPETFINVLKR